MSSAGSSSGNTGPLPVVALPVVSSAAVAAGVTVTRCLSPVGGVSGVGGPLLGLGHGGRVGQRRDLVRLRGARLQRGDVPPQLLGQVGPEARLEASQLPDGDLEIVALRVQTVEQLGAATGDLGVEVVGALLGLGLHPLGGLLRLGRDPLRSCLGVRR